GVQRTARGLLHRSGLEGEGIIRGFVHHEGWRDGGMEVREWVVAAQGGDRVAVGGLGERHQGVGFRLCYRVAGNLHDAEDLAHEAFVEAYLKLHQLRDPERFVPWLKRLALNVCRMWWRRSRREPVELMAEVPEPVAEADRGVYARM